MNNKSDQIKTDAEGERAQLASLWDEHISSSMHTKTSQEEWANYGSDAHIVITVARKKNKRSVCEKVDFIYAGRPQA